KLPVHDADVMSLSVHTSRTGVVGLDLTLEIDPQESLEAFANVGVAGPGITLHFENCWQIVSNFLCYRTQRDQVFNWDVIHESNLIQKIQDAGAASTLELLHHKLDFASGSSLEIVAEKVFVGRDGVGQ